MTTANDLLVLAYRLSLLTFNIGVLIYSLPIPFTSIKRWAPRLIQDGILAFTLVVLYDISFELANKIALILGGSWQLFSSWIMSGAAEMLNIKMLTVVVAALPDPIGITDGLLTVLKPIDKLATTALYFLGFVAGLSYIVSEYGGFLAALGLALYAVPFRITRAAGAWLFSFVIVFTIGLQAMPVFVTQIGGPPVVFGGNDVATNGIALVQLNVTSAGGPVEGELHVYDYVDNEEYASYVVENGSAMSDSGVRILSIPSNPQIYYALEYEGVTFFLIPYPVNKTDYDFAGGIWKLTLYSPHIIRASDGLLVYTNGYVSNVSDDGEVLSAEVYLEAGQYVAVRYASTCTIGIDSGGLSGEEGSWEWREVEGEYSKFIADTEGYYTIKVYYYCEKPLFKYYKNDYANDIGMLFSFFTLNVLQAFFNYWFTIPFLYIALLGTAATGLARAIGGRERLPVRIF